MQQFRQVGRTRTTYSNETHTSDFRVSPWVSQSGHLTHARFGSGYLSTAIESYLHSGHENLNIREITSLSNELVSKVLSGVRRWTLVPPKPVQNSDSLSGFGSVVQSNSWQLRAYVSVHRRETEIQ